MNCDEARPKLTAFLDAELTGDVVSALEAHLKNCDPCSRALTEYQSLQGAAKESTPIETVDIWASIRNQISSSPDQELLEDFRLMRQEMQALREEVAALRLELTRNRPVSLPRSTGLNLPDAPSRSLNPFRLV